MNLCVAGLWHLGCVTAACMSDLGAYVTGITDDTNTINNLNNGHAPIFEPGLDDLIQKNLSEGKLKFSDDVKNSVVNSDYIWVCYDTPVDENDNADEKFVLDKIFELVNFMNDRQGLLISSQLPAGTAKKIESYIASLNKKIPVCYSPENLRLGNAIEIFKHPDRIIAGTRTKDDREFFARLLNLIPSEVIWMRTESAEMAKHAINAFLATSVAFINELSQICEDEGADAREVSKALKSESRIGPKAYLSPGGAFAGGTLARDLRYILKKADASNFAAEFFNGVIKSNDRHKNWVYAHTKNVLGEISNKKIFVLGLTYKTGTDTLRRSQSLETIFKFHDSGANVKAYDANVKTIPDDIANIMQISTQPEKDIIESDCIVVFSYNPENNALNDKTIINAVLSMKNPVIIDQNGIFFKDFAENPNVKYFSVGLKS